MIQLCYEGQKWLIVVEDTGLAEGFSLVVLKTKPQGVLVLKGMAAFGTCLSLS